MTPKPPPQITQLLRAWSAGISPRSGKSSSWPIPSYTALRADICTTNGRNHTIQATALVNEAYLRLVNIGHVEWKDRAHFLAVGARIMRRILVDYARSRPRPARVDITEDLAVSPQLDLDIVLLDQALETLAGFDARKAKVVEMRFFGGLTADESAAVLGVAPQTVHRDWSLAKAWLIHEMKREGKHGPATLGQD